ncbi:hypothetical protein BT93_L0819 [Corymbia citriodora subsp. variegata]|uniref:PGG domain-containing protein n=1 Tax=Corymbia citriodora subsp. variegata TaxID=360336 RepID=A0A8T0CT07_CORYI|nr:hypothetical protein BT93_L0819 [Corymbia citriodora subsp. variegata]
MARDLPEKEEKEARESRLQLAIANDDVDELHNLIVEERELLDRVSKDPFPNTPLHLAAAAGKTQVAMEVVILRPSFARKLNPEGHSPMHLALQHEEYQTVRALMTFDPELIQVPGRCGITPLHYVAGKEGDNELELLAEFLCACKLSIEDLTSQCETAVHIAVKNHNFKAFQVLFGWLKRVYLTKILDWKDQDGNTVLHIAVSGEPQIEKTAIEIFRYFVKRLRSVGRVGRPPTPSPSLSHVRDESDRNIIIAVATLIATATYQAALSPPGGFWGDNSSNLPANSTAVTANSSGIAVEKPHEAGNIILTGSKLYQFTAVNSTVFLASIVTIWITALPLLTHTPAVYLLTSCVGCAYYATFLTGFSKSDAVVGGRILAAFWALLSVAVAVPTISLRTYTKYRRQLQMVARGRRVGKFLELMDRK